MWTDLVVQTVRNVPRLEEEDKPHGVCEVPVAANSLLTSHADVNQNPENEAGTEFVEGFEVEGANGRVKPPANEPLNCEKRSKTRESD